MTGNGFRAIHGLFLLLSLVLGAAWTPRAAAQQYEIIDLGTMGGESCMAKDVNSEGVVLGSVSYAVWPNPPVMHTFRWQAGSTEDLGAIGGVYAINDSGQMAGTAPVDTTCCCVPRTGATLSGQAGVPALWPGPEPCGSPFSACCVYDLSVSLCGQSGRELNNLGVLVGDGTFPESYPNVHAFVCTGSIQDLGTLPGDNRSWATDVNDAGVVVGYSDRVDGPATAVTWTNGQIDPLAPLSENYPSKAVRINEAGVIAGEAANLFTGSVWKVVYWNGEGIHDIGVTGHATDINVHGDMVGESYPGWTPFLYRDGVVHNLFDLIPAGHGWGSFKPLAINDDGWIVGYARPPGGTSQDQRAVILRPLPSLELVALEVAQSVSNWKNDIPIIEGKATYVNAYLRTIGAEQVKATACLRGFRGGEELPGSPLSTCSKGGYIMAGPEIDRGERRGVIAFKIPREWRQGHVEFRLDGAVIEGVSPTFDCQGAMSELLECSDAAGPSPDDCSVTVDFLPAPALRVKLISVGLDRAEDPSWNPKIRSGPSLEDLRKLAGRLLYMYPVSEVRSRFGSYACTQELPYNVNVLKRELEEMRRMDDPDFFYYGAVWLMTGKDCPDCAGWVLGSAIGIPGGTAVGVTSTTPNTLQSYQYYSIPGHELGHCLGLHHTVDPSLGTQPIGSLIFKQGHCGEFGDAWAPDFPYWYNMGLPFGVRPALGPIDMGEDEAVYGTDLWTGRTLDPYTHWDLMSYCNYDAEDWVRNGTLESHALISWPSRFTYAGLLQAILQGGGGPLPPPLATEPLRSAQNPAVRLEPAALSPAMPLGNGVGGEWIALRGTVNYTEDTAVLLPLIRYASPAVPEPPPAGEYVLRLLDGAGQLLEEISFQPTGPVLEAPLEGIGEAPPLSGTFFIPVPADPAIAAALVLHGGVELVSVSASSNAPSVQLLHPNGGETLSEDPVVISWTGHDPDGDSLLHTVRYSADDGATWETLAIDRPGTSCEIGRANLKGTTQGRIRVTVSDGFLTAASESDGTFTVPNNPPLLAILDPGDGLLFVGEQPVFFQADVWDREDGDLNASPIEWQSSLGGPLGTGNDFSVPASALAEGEHVITAGAGDSQGGTAGASVTIRVLREAPAELADLAVEAFTPLEEIGLGDPLRFTLTVTNNGPGEANGVTLTDTLPESVVFAGAVPGQGDCVASAGVLVCELGGLAPGQATSVQLDVTATAAGALVNTAAVSGNGTDPDLGDNEAETIVYVKVPDQDGDGVPDMEDNCPEDANPDQGDGDGDGAGDACDGCPADPGKVEPGGCGCGTPDVDSDGDGVFDCIDNCPGTANPDQADSDGNGAGDACEAPSWGVPTSTLGAGSNAGSKGFNRIVLLHLPLALVLVWRRRVRRRRPGPSCPQDQECAQGCQEKGKPVRPVAGSGRV